VSEFCLGALRLGVLAVLFLILDSNVFAQEIPKGVIQLYPDSIKWIDAPPPLPAGSMIAVIEGNPKQESIFTMRVKLPPYYKISSHLHPKDERVTVIEGAVYVGFGETMDTSNAAKFTAGCYYVNPANLHHYVFTGSEGCIFQVTGLGPWGITYIENEK
jgi:quercetin dioxygenase-like cupin family protein